MAKKNLNHPDLRAVLVATSQRGLFFGYVGPEQDLTTARSVALIDARNCLYWPAETHGFLGLAASGPGKKCRVGPAADILVHDVICVAKVGDKARLAWESEPWGGADL